MGRDRILLLPRRRRWAVVCTGDKRGCDRHPGKKIQSRQPVIANRLWVCSTSERIIVERMLRARPACSCCSLQPAMTVPQLKSLCFPGKRQIHILNGILRRFRRRLFVCIRAFQGLESCGPWFELNGRNPAQDLAGRAG